jgi:hypothetical protein
MHAGVLQQALSAYLRGLDGTFSMRSEAMKRAMLGIEQVTTVAKR